MTFLRAVFAFPLLGRELTERAARRRTYVARVLYGACLYGVFGLMAQRAIREQMARGFEMGALGLGYDLLGALVKALTWSLLFVQPAMMGGSITREKERDAFGLLLLTRLSPGRILLEKYFAGLFPTATLLLLALPLAAVTMAYGGVSFQLLVASGMVLVATWLMVGAWALLSSAWCRTSLGALLLSYLGGAALMLAAPLAYTVLRRDVLFGSDLLGVDVPSWLWALWPQEVFATLLTYQRETFSSAAGSGNSAAFAWEAARRCGALFTAAAIFLFLARLVMLPRAAIPPGGRNEWLRRLARFIPQRCAKPGKERPRDLPADAPIAWREYSRSFLGSGTRFAYFAFLIWGSTVALSIFLLELYPETHGPERLHRLGIFCGCAAMFVLVSSTVSSLLNERMNRTLDILFTTPMGIGEMLREKARSVSRYWLLFGVTLAIIFGAEAWSDYEYVHSGATWQSLGRQWATGILALTVYPPLVIWISFLFATVWGKRARAILGVLGLFGIWAMLPLLALEFFDPSWRDSQAHLWHSLISPLGIIDANAHNRLPWFTRTAVGAGRYFEVRGAPWVPVSVNFGFYALLGWLARWTCLRTADRLLRR
jgi:hypothetical protein